ncbi:TPA: hypothetical protein SML50_001457 [Serratia fonticola]|nr:hypothetical protein [Serratia fonticola]
MAKPSAERKAEQRARQRAAGDVVRELRLDAQENQMVEEACVIRRPGREPYDLNEYVSMLIRKDHAELKERLAELNGKKCQRCGEQLPVGKCCLDTEAACWVNLGWHDLKLM